MNWGHFQFELKIRIYVNFAIVIHPFIYTPPPQPLSSTFCLPGSLSIISFECDFWACVLWFFDLKSEFMALASYQPELQYVIINLRKGGFFLCFILISLLLMCSMRYICVCASFVFYFSFYFLVYWLLSLVVVVVVVLFLAATFVYPTICQLSFNKRFEMFFFLSVRLLFKISVYR